MIWWTIAGIFALYLVLVVICVYFGIDPPDLDDFPFFGGD